MLENFIKLIYTVKSFTKCVCQIISFVNTNYIIIFFKWAGYIQDFQELQESRLGPEGKKHIVYTNFSFCISFNEV